MSTKRLSNLLFLVATFLLPIVTYASHQSIPACLINGGKGIIQYICFGIHIIGLLVPITFGVAIVFFLYGVAKFIVQSNNDKDREEGKKVIVWGVIALFVGVSVAGFIELLSYIIGTGTGGAISVP